MSPYLLICECLPPDLEARMANNMTDIDKDALQRRDSVDIFTLLKLAPHGDSGPLSLQALIQGYTKLLGDSCKSFLRS